MEKRVLHIDIQTVNIITLKKREKQISLVTSNKGETYLKNSALQIPF